MTNPKESWWHYTPTKDALEWCLENATRMAEGARTYSFKNNRTQSIDVYRIGKIGELAVYHWLQESGLRCLHTPFRESYEKFDFRDDFQIVINGSTHQIEVRTKERTVFPKPHYMCCSDSIKAGILYMFVSFNSTRGVATLVGWADPQNFANRALHIWKGTPNRGFKGGVHKVNEFNIRIQDLLPLETLKNGELNGL